VPCRPLATMIAEATGSAVLAILLLKKPATPAAAPAGPSATGSHIILLPKLALSCSKKISAAVTSAPAAVRADRPRSNRPVSTLRTILSMPCAACSGRLPADSAFHGPSLSGLPKAIAAGGRRGWLARVEAPATASPPGSAQTGTSHGSPAGRAEVAGHPGGQQGRRSRAALNMRRFKLPAAGMLPGSGTGI
jgi:hypothetical protein